MSRMIYHSKSNRLSCAIDVQPGRVLATITRCATKEEFSGTRANQILNGRLDKFEVRGQKSEDVLGMYVCKGDAPITDKEKARAFDAARKFIKTRKRNVSFKDTQDQFFLTIATA